MIEEEHNQDSVSENVERNGSFEKQNNEQSEPDHHHVEGYKCASSLLEKCKSQEVLQDFIKEEVDDDYLFVLNLDDQIAWAPVQALFRTVGSAGKFRTLLGEYQVRNHSDVKNEIFFWRITEEVHMTHSKIQSPDDSLDFQSTLSAIFGGFQEEYKDESLLK